nr:unnamed protein product [Callosobruchus chinensis]
MEVGLLVSGN